MYDIQSGRECRSSLMTSLTLLAPLTVRLVQSLVLVLYTCISRYPSGHMYRLHLYPSLSALLLLPTTLVLISPILRRVFCSRCRRVFRMCYRRAHEVQPASPVSSVFVTSLHPARHEHIRLGALHVPWHILPENVYWPAEFLLKPPQPEERPAHAPAKTEDGSDEGRGEEEEGRRVLRFSLNSMVEIPPGNCAVVIQRASVTSGSGSNITCEGHSAVSVSLSRRSSSLSRKSSYVSMRQPYDKSSAKTSIESEIKYIMNNQRPLYSSGSRKTSSVINTDVITCAGYDVTPGSNDPHRPASPIINSVENEMATVVPGCRQRSYSRVKTWLDVCQMPPEAASASGISSTNLDTRQVETSDSRGNKTAEEQDV